MAGTIVDHIATWSELTLAIIGAIGATWVGMKKLYKMARNIERLVETTELNSKRLQHIEKQVIANGGTSLRDAVHRIESQTSGIEKRVTKLEHLPCHLHAEADLLSAAVGK